MQRRPGYRALQTKADGPKRQDTVVAVGALAAACVFLAYLRAVHTPWAPIVIYSTLGTLVFMASYDLVRLTFPRRSFARLWIYEHLVKMLAAYSAVVSAFAGTVLTRWQPFSQLMPSVLSACAMVGFSIHIARQERQSGTASSSGRDRASNGKAGRDAEMRDRGRMRSN